MRRTVPGSVPVADPLGFGKHELYDPPEAETVDVDVEQLCSDIGSGAEVAG